MPSIKRCLRRRKRGKEVFSYDEAGPDSSRGGEQVKQLLSVLAEVIPAPKERPFQLLGLDVTPSPRPYARTLEDRTFIYQPNTIKGNKPIYIGHPYSILSVLPEKVALYPSPWVIPLSGVRVDSSSSGRVVGSALARPTAQAPGLRSYWTSFTC